MSSVEIRGWKTKVGALFLAAVAGIQTYTSIPGIEATWAPEVSAALAGLGAAFGVLGIGHKVEKAKVKNIEEAQRILNVERTRLEKELENKT